MCDLPLYQEYWTSYCASVPQLSTVSAMIHCHLCRRFVAGSIRKRPQWQGLERWNKRCSNAIRKNRGRIFILWRNPSLWMKEVRSSWRGPTTWQSLCNIETEEDALFLVSPSWWSSLWPLSAVSSLVDRLCWSFRFCFRFYSFFHCFACKSVLLGRCLHYIISITFWYIDDQNESFRCHCLSARKKHNTNNWYYTRKKPTVSAPVRASTSVLVLHKT